MLLLGLPGDDQKLTNRTLAKQKVNLIFEDKLKLNNFDIDKCNRLGPAQKSHPQAQAQSIGTRRKPRPVLITFNRLSDREYVWSNRRLLKDTDMILKEDLPLEMEGKVKTLLPICKEAKRQNKKASLVRDQLFINGEKFTEESLDRLPPSLHPEKLSTKETSDKFFFWGKRCPLSNFYPCNFVEGKVFNCVEQYFCFEKSSFFEDEVAKQKIMSTDDPVIMKKTPISGFSANDWSHISSKVMETGLA